MARGGGGLQKPRGLYEGGLLTRKKKKTVYKRGRYDTGTFLSPNHQSQ